MNRMIQLAAIILLSALVAAPAVALELIGTKGPDRLSGNDGNDVLIGKRGDDVLQGNGGDDVLRGGRDNDELYGGTGNDELDGGKGDDTFTGGHGADRFVFQFSAKGDNIITDFDPCAGDRIMLYSNRTGRWPSVADILASEVQESGGYTVYTLRNGLTVETSIPLETEDFAVKEGDSVLGSVNESEIIARIVGGAYEHVYVFCFVPVAVASGQVTEEEINRFIKNAHVEFSRQEAKALHEQEYDQKAYGRWDIEIEGGGAVQIFRTRSVREFSAGWTGVLKVLEALKTKETLPGLNILVRGTERFFDIEGIGGVGSRTWIAFDLRGADDVFDEGVNESKIIARIVGGAYERVSTSSFVPVAVASGQVTEEEINRFIKNAHVEFSRQEAKALHEQEYDQKAYGRWDIEIEGGGAVQIFRTRSVREFSAGWTGVLKVLEALRTKETLTGLNILVRGTERFFDIEGIGGVGSRTWIAFDLR